MQLLIAAYFPDSAEKGGDLRGRYCEKLLPQNTRSVVCTAPLCHHILRLLQHKGQTEEQLPTDNSDPDMRERIRSWQIINAAQRLQRKGLLGHFFFVCPCGESPTSGNHYNWRCSMWTQHRLFFELLLPQQFTRGPDELGMLHQAVYIIKENLQRMQVSFWVIIPW